MATNSVETDSIVVYPVFEKEQITFRVKEEYNLQKLGIGAYKLSVLENESLKHLLNIHHHIVVSSTDYIILHNVAEDAGLSAVLILTNPVAFSRDHNLFKIVYPAPFKFDVPVQIEHNSIPNDERGSGSSEEDDDQINEISTTDVDMPETRFKLPEFNVPNSSTSKSLFDRYV